MKKDGQDGALGTGVQKRAWGQRVGCFWSGQSPPAREAGPRAHEGVRRGGCVETRPWGREVMGSSFPHAHPLPEPQVCPGQAVPWAGGRGCVPCRCPHVAPRSPVAEARGVAVVTVLCMEGSRAVPRGTRQGGGPAPWGPSSPGPRRPFGISHETQGPLSRGHGGRESPGWLSWWTRNSGSWGCEFEPQVGC